jgi:hypothetical protein
MQKTAYSFSRFLSYILHPLLIPTLVTWALMMRSDLYSIILPVSIKVWFISLVFFFTMVLPVIGVFLLLKLKVINSIEMNHRSERTVPLLISSISFMALLYYIKSVGLPPIFLYVLYSATFAMLAGLLINLVYKISLHTLGWGAVAATLTSVSLRIGIPLLLFIITAILICGIAGFARLKQNAHNPTQVYLGFVAGVSIIILISFFG